MKYRTILSIFFVLMILDFLSTYIALNVLTGFVEMNTVPRYFFNFGLNGWIVWFIISSIFIMITSLIIFSGPKIIRKSIVHDEKSGRIYSEKFKKNLERIVLYVPFSYLFYIYFSTIINNFSLIIQNLN